MNGSGVESSYMAGGRQMARPRKQPIITWTNVTEFIQKESNMQTLQFIQYTLKTRIETLENGAADDPA
jgi:hypothetical protein